MDTMEIKLIGLDLDGTVFNNKKEITPRTKDAILRAIDAGVVVVPTTGRPRAGLPKEFIEIPSIRYAISWTILIGIPHPNNTPPIFAIAAILLIVSAGLSKKHNCQSKRFTFCLQKRKQKQTH